VVHDKALLPCLATACHCGFAWLLLFSPRIHCVVEGGLCWHTKQAWCLHTKHQQLRVYACVYTSLLIFFICSRHSTLIQLDCLQMQCQACLCRAPPRACPPQHALATCKPRPSVLWPGSNCSTTLQASPVAGRVCPPRHAQATCTY